MTSTITPSQVVDMSNEKDWSMNLGMLDWDATSIIFTKRSLVEFLKYTGTTVDPGFSNIQKLPRYAKFGKLTSTGEEPLVTSSGQLVAEELTGDVLPTAATPIVTELVQSSNSASQHDVVSKFKPTRRVTTQPGGHDSIGNLFGEKSQERFVATRKVSQRPGGHDNIEQLFH